MPMFWMGIELGGPGLLGGTGQSVMSSSVGPVTRVGAWHSNTQSCGEQLTGDHYPAWFDVQAPGSCGMGADQTLSARDETDQALTGAPGETIE